ILACWIIDFARVEQPIGVISPCGQDIMRCKRFKLCGNGWIRQTRHQPGVTDYLDCSGLVARMGKAMVFECEIRIKSGSRYPSRQRITSRVGDGKRVGKVLFRRREP